MTQAHIGQWLWLQLHEYAEQLEHLPHARKAWLAAWFATVKRVLECQSCYRKLEIFCKKWPPTAGWGLTPMVNLSA